VDGDVRRIPALCAIAWAIGTAGALALTLASLSEYSFDGLNNLLQIPFALPWFLLPLPAIFNWSNTTDAWATALMGWVNSVLIYLLLMRRARRRDAATHAPI
jgi:hypothetical protein